MLKEICHLARAVAALLKDDAGGVGDMVMELAIIGAGAKTIFTSIRSGMEDLGTSIQDTFSETTIP